MTLRLQIVEDKIYERESRKHSNITGGYTVFDCSRILHASRNLLLSE